MQPLDGSSVLVTRPVEQCEPLARAIEQQGGTAIRAPMIIVAGLDDDSRARKVVSLLDGFDMAIFISRNAVEFGLDLIAREGLSLADKAVFAVGLGTAGALRERGIDTSHVVRDDSRPTTRKTRYVSKTAQVLRVDEERRHPVGAGPQQKILELLAQRPFPYDAVLLRRLRAITSRSASQFGSCASTK